MFGFVSWRVEQAAENLRAVQMMTLAKLGQTMGRVDTLDTWIPYVKALAKRIDELEKKVAELERQVKPPEGGGSGTGHYGAGPWG
jgi:hypothetical protein